MKSAKQTNFAPIQKHSHTNSTEEKNCVWSGQCGIQCICLFFVLYFFVKLYTETQFHSVFENGTKCWYKKRNALIECVVKNNSTHSMRAGGRRVFSTNRTTKPEFSSKNSDFPHHNDKISMQCSSCGKYENPLGLCVATSLFAIKSCIEFPKMTTSGNQIVALHSTFYESIFYTIVWMVLPIPTHVISGIRWRRWKPTRK